jgi:hypothetical protein
MDMAESDTSGLRHRLLTGTDDRAFCKRVSGALDDGYRLFGSPAITVRDGEVVAAQAVVKPDVAT